jgi:hypothetical protein
MMTNQQLEDLVEYYRRENRSQNDELWNLRKIVVFLIALCCAMALFR